ncbi:DUF2971 domain-containing protein [Pseudomonas capsici]|uniref:DUF2971 domain-containing protein n=1 Tax=Pseudomonas capsici TaxID=2810614 RepID=UPI0021F24535|nr:DUF2971 domain-containing protein [Pseudomonas capsici]MCV4290442.1 DUF2971 domain-containing protein [Pseudomonas capsici]
MAFFKYYRPGCYFDNAIRYNELYFSENKELNDPHDLKASFYFEDSIELWGALLALKPEYDTWNLNIFIDTKSRLIWEELNELFKGKAFDSIKGNISEEIEKNKQGLLDIFKKHLKVELSLPENISFHESYPSEQRAELCSLWLSALLARAVDHVFFSASFSASALSPMMWAHYADGFKGCVIIYEPGPEGVFGLTHNLFDRDQMRFQFQKVNYIDGDKRIPVLECAVKGKAKAQYAFLQKNAFWEYECEHRLLSAEKSDAILESIGKVRRSSQRTRVLHHQTNDIVGVIFGPRCTPQLKEKVDLTLLDNRRRAGNKPFYLFDTELTLQGQLVISSAKMQCCTVIPGLPVSPGGLHQMISAEELPRVLAAIGIHEHNLRSE